MSSIIAQKYANLLTMEDVVRLFKLLEDAVGNKVEAAKLCGLERKTTYGWEATNEVRLRTKKKVLTALVENLTEETLDFITKRSVETSVDILRTHLSVIYEKAMDERTDASTFLHLASKFEATKQKYAGLITDHLVIEVGNMSALIPEKASELKVPFTSAPINLLKISELSKLIPSLIKTVSAVSPCTSDNEIAKIFNLPEEFVHTFSTALHESCIAIRAPTVSLKIIPSHYEGEQDTASTVQLHPPQPLEAEHREWIKKAI
jgi:hypothetical protein